jgi:hypothetical protein
MRTTLLLALLIVGGTAQASEWKELGGNTDGSHTVSIDVSSIRFEGALRLAWFKHQYAPSLNMHDKSGPDRDKLWSYSKVRYGFNCTNETYQMDANTIVYFMDGSSGSDPTFERLPWKPVPPDSILEAQMQFICAWTPQ